ncbi:hypothetical protein SKAU_G00081140 [Synaphobranchus kaupii]|uniref:Uncharacterized protein n=1 Tax=Synaphobranchus kaupii TaxID=118154 RepID=A0A9Q1J5I2_SYNKA|nr:hypothetical protein SKAU_G00081140 [Synaphobranchus kaupii]
MKFMNYRSRMKISRSTDFSAISDSFRCSPTQNKVRKTHCSSLISASESELTNSGERWPQTFADLVKSLPKLRW